MDEQERREELIRVLTEAKDPLSSGELSKLFDVSKQTIVQDITALKASNKRILSTAKGYIIYKNEGRKAFRTFVVKHTSSQMEDELISIVDLGGKVINVGVSHPLFGEFLYDIDVFVPRDVTEHCELFVDPHVKPLLEITGGMHYHKIEADSESSLNSIEAMLKAKGYYRDIIEEDEEEEE